MRPRRHTARSHDARRISTICDHSTGDITRRHHQRRVVIPFHRIDVTIGGEFEFWTIKLSGCGTKRGDVQHVDRSRTRTTRHHPSSRVELNRIHRVVRPRGSRVIRHPRQRARAVFYQRAHRRAAAHREPQPFPRPVRPDPALARPQIPN